MQALDSWPEHLSGEAFRFEAARSRRHFKKEEAFRLLLVVDRQRADLVRMREKARALIANGVLHTPHEGIYLGTGLAAGGLAMLFPVKDHSTSGCSGPWRARSR